MLGDQKHHIPPLAPGVPRPQPDSPTRIAEFRAKTHMTTAPRDPAPQNLENPMTNSCDRHPLKANINKLLKNISIESNAMNKVTKSLGQNCPKNRPLYTSTKKNVSSDKKPTKDANHKITIDIKGKNISCNIGESAGGQPDFKNSKKLPQTAHAYTPAKKNQKKLKP
jgi:hypothetical protein